MFAIIFERVTAVGARLKKIKQSDLFMKLKFYYYDLTKFDDDAQARLESDHIDSHYMSSVYFDDTERDQLLQHPTSQGLTFKRYMELFYESKSDATALCSSHDLAPIIRNVFDIPKGFDKDNAFINAHKDFIKMHKKGNKKKKN
jgi:hypothetical protein